MQQNFKLVPFDPQTAPDIGISGQVDRTSNHLNISYLVTGEWTALEIPALADIPTRQHNLWQTTCFEFFLGKTGTSQYWEFNLSPSGDWNTYHFSNYRQGMQEERAIAVLPFCFEFHSTGIELNVSLDLTALVAASQPLQLSITAVIKTQALASAISYWALTHAAPQPDFHQRDSFILVL